MVKLFDMEKCSETRQFLGHKQRVAAVDLSEDCLASGSKDKSILITDIRSKEIYDMKLEGHKQEVCGLKWSGWDSLIASGGNDNKFFIWEGRMGKK